MNRAYTGLIGMIATITIPAIVAWNRQPFLIWWGGSALCFAVVLVVTAFVIEAIHRRNFAKLLRRDGLGLIEFGPPRGCFVSYIDQPWWKWNAVYFGSAVSNSGESTEYWFSISGPFYALIRPELSYESNSDQDDA